MQCIVVNTSIACVFAILPLRMDANIMKNAMKTKLYTARTRTRTNTRWHRFCVDSNIAVQFSARCHYYLHLLIPWSECVFMGLPACEWIVCTALTQYLRMAVDSEE